jgi:2-aminoadipate transaminase
MRLNFSGVGEDDIREGIRRIGEVVREQVALYGTLTGSGSGASAAPDTSAGEPEPRPHDVELAKVLQLPTQRKRAG